MIIINDYDFEDRHIRMIYVTEKTGEMAAENSARSNTTGINYILKLI